ncbi:MAG: 23S rRNA (pseudouridine(1915)-N(3))-methyltransferase RlmH [Acholeplasmatales bacterium]|nr:23S rRNA (pseudouridine(1915)-N(3))-methyltransferase RlmH [Acholeplasmatales bacterium]
MKITILSVGNIKEKYFIDAIEEYSKRLTKYTKIVHITIDDLPIANNPSDKDIEIIKNKEGKKILEAIDNDSYKIALDLKGKLISSEELAAKIDEIATYNSSNITFIIGGSLGISSEVLNQCDYRLCISKMTFPHKLCKVILLEQIYRAFKINNNETYHK